MPFLDFDPHKSYLELKSVRVCGALLTITSFSLACVIAWSSQPLNVDTSFNGFNNALNIFKLPLGVIALIIPIFALLAANHRSEQSKEQMRIAQEQNNFSNHYKHVEEFEKYCSNMDKTESIISGNIRRLHLATFPKSRSGSYELSEELFRAASKISNAILAFYQKKDADQIALEKDLMEIDLLTLRIRKRFEMTDGMLGRGTNNIRMKDCIKQAAVTLKYLVAIAEFDGGYTPSVLETVILDIDVQSRPDQIREALTEAARMDESGENRKLTIE
ncbi:hypothetical protein [Pseudomonas abyssi]|uniref:hypothetical protein n=1 Tax=Pseudomonas abyssi TaxID=170540 RepID=UPI003C7E81A8